MNTALLIKSLTRRILIFSWFIAALAIGLGYFFYYIAKQEVGLYQGKATVFPLNATAASPGASGVSGLLGIGDAGGSFSSADASVNIVELANSRRISEVVANTRVPEMNNKTVAELLIIENNKFTGYRQNVKIDMPKDSLGLTNVGVGLLRAKFTVKVSKLGILELSFASPNPDIVRHICYIYIDKLSEFYIELKKKKAQSDFAFAVMKADSLKQVLDDLDAKTIYLDEHTFFTPTERARYSLPQEMLATERSLVKSQYFYAINNREAAAYKLQKETPIMQPLDRPEPPFNYTQKSAMVNAIIGALIGFVLGLLIVSWSIISKIIGSELNKAISKNGAPAENNVPPTGGTV
jgi:hypothetical protein